MATNRIGGSRTERVQTTSGSVAKSSIVVALNNGDLTSDEAEDAAELLFDVAALTGGYELSDATAFATKVTKLMGQTEIPPKKEAEPVEAEVVE